MYFMSFIYNKVRKVRTSQLHDFCRSEADVWVGDCSRWVRDVGVQHELLSPVTQNSRKFRRLHNGKPQLGNRGSRAVTESLFYDSQEQQQRIHWSDADSWGDV